MLNILKKRIQQVNNLFDKSRANGSSVSRSLAIVIFTILNTYFKKFNIGEDSIRMELMDINPKESDSINNLIANTVSSKNKNEHAKINKDHSKKLYIWVVPHCTNIWGGGHYTLFRFIAYFTKNKGSQNIIYLYNYDGTNKTQEALQSELNLAFATDQFLLISDADQLPDADAVVATTWQSVYSADRLTAKEKFYFVQDYESLFYPGGALSMQANHTYTFGYHGVTGGGWLKSMYESYGNKAQAYIFSADRHIFYPADPINVVRDKVKKLFFYGRPSTPRRAFELGIAALELVAKHYPDIEIVIAGLSGISPPNFKCTLLGNLSLKETGDLYRTCDIGIALSGTNMSYLPVELMASGCPVISNSGPQVEWFCKNDQNALLAAPLPSSIFESVRKLVDSKELRQKLAKNGLDTISQTTWEQEMEKIYQYMDSKFHSDSVQGMQQAVIS